MKKKCPLCGKEIEGKTENGITRYYCNCSGKLRSVIEVIPDNTKGVKDDSTH